jgi:hypothetical protein
VRASRGRRTVRLTVSCPAAERGGCIGSLTLVTAKPVSIGGVRARVLLGSARYALRPGQRRTLTVALPSGLSRLARRGKIDASAQTVTRDGAGNVATRAVAVSLLSRQLAQKRNRCCGVRQIREQTRR